MGRYIGDGWKKNVQNTGFGVIICCNDSDRDLLSLEKAITDCGFNYTRTILELGYPKSTMALRNWYNEYRSTGELHQKNDELSELHLQLAQLQSHDTLIKERVKNTDVVRMIQNKGRKGKTLTMNEWEMVEQVLHQVSPDFIPSLMALYPLNDVEKQVCMLLKLEIPLSCIAAMVCRDKSAVSKIRQRLYKKAFGTDAPPSAWDEVIASL